MSAYEQLKSEMSSAPRQWLVTGVAGFIGSNLLETLLKLDQRVIGLDNLSTGRHENLQQVQARVTPSQWERFRWREGDIRDLAVCRKACAGVDVLLHQAALGSVPASMADPMGCHESNVTGFLNMLLAARDANVKRFVYASSSAIYGDDATMPKVEDKIGKPLSPYAASKTMNELYADAFACTYKFGSIGLRYFNVFGPRQDPEGAYAAVIPKWISALLKREPIFINGDGETSRDFCFIENVVQANLLAATRANPAAINQAFNIGLGKQTTLNQLFEILQAELRRLEPELTKQKPIYRDFRPGDVHHSVADISKAHRLLGFEPTRGIQDGLRLAMEWYRNHF